MKKFIKSSSKFIKTKNCWSKNSKSTLPSTFIGAKKQTYTKMSSSEAFVETLHKQKVTDVFGIVGSAFMDALDLFPNANIRFISVQHEQNAAHMADGYSRVSKEGKHGVCVAQNGPGVTNFVTGIASAYWAHSPVVMIAPEGGTKTVGLGGFQETDQMAIFPKITKAQYHLNNPERMSELTGKAFDAAKINNGPVQLNIPRDYFYAVHDYAIPEPKKIEAPAGSLNSIKAAAKLLSKAKNPVILAGGGVGMSSKGTENVVELAEKYNIPLVCSYLHNDVIPATNKLYCGPLGYQGNKAGMKLIKEADLVIAMGTRLGPFGTLPQYDYTYWPPTNGKVIQVDVNQNALGNTYNADLLIHGDAGETTAAISRELKDSLDDGDLSKSKDKRLKKVQSRQKEWEKELDEMTYMETKHKGMRPRRALRELEKAIPMDSVVSTDIGNICSVANSYLKFSQPKSFLAAMTFGSCGYSVPAAMGAKVSSPERTVFSYTGDGAFGMSIPEIMTCVREKIPITMVVFNNGQWGAEKKNQVIWFDDRYMGTNLDNNPSYAGIAKAMGAQGIRVTDPKDIKAAVEKSIKNQKDGKATVLELVVSKELGSPFRRDAMKVPKRILPKYQDKTVQREKLEDQPTDINNREF